MSAVALGAAVMGSVVRGLRAAEAEFAAWAALAASLGLSFNGWAVRALRDQAELDRALLREREEQPETL